MNGQSATFQRIQIRPIEALYAGKDLVSDQYWLFVGITVVGVILGSLVPFGIIMGALLCGIYMCYFTKMRGEVVSFEMLFKGFDHFVESLIAMLVLVGIMLAVFIPLYVVLIVAMISGFAGNRGGGDATGMMMLLLFGVFYLIVLVVSLLVFTFTMFAFPLIVDRQLKAIPALKTSCQATLANLRTMVPFVLTLGVVSVVAALLCYLPALLVMPITFGAIAVVYRQMFPELPTGTTA